ncbi:MAG TPA: ABC transporter substrate-binding protein, partial [Verrucomicrobiales bacterium]|nr:ABC transporter substrate-binding protein [Verrucomicrobiales bacterium]
PTEDRGAALRRFQAGELHSNNDAPVEQIAFMRETLGKQFRVAPYLGTYYYAVNTRKKPFDDPRVRRALA